MVVLFGITMLLGLWRPTRDASGAGFVEIDAVVTDRDGHPVHGLRASDFVLKEDHRVAPILTVHEVAGVPSGSHEPCLLAVVLDDASVVPVGTDAMQRTAEAFLAPAAAADRIAIVSLSQTPSELLFGRLSDALLAIRHYTARGDVQFDEPTLSGWLALLAHVATQFSEADGRRNTVVAFGNPILLDPNVGAYRTLGGSSSRWMNAVARMAQANAALYVIDANGMNGYWPDADFGMAAESGGKRFSTLNVRRAFDEIWQDMTNYYVISYVPLTSRPLHDIDVSVAQRGMRIHARRQRGE